MDEMLQCGYAVDDIAFVDIHASDRFYRWKVGESPTLTRARTQAGGWWILPLQRQTSTEEMLRLQGIDPRFVGEYAAVKPRIFNAAIGNCMSVNVLERVLPRLLYASGILSRSLRDKWDDEAWVARGARPGVA